MGKSTQLKVPSFNFKQLGSATDDCFMVHEGILYHNDLCNVRNGDIRDGNGSSRKAKVKDVKKMIRGSDSLSDVFVAAIWQTFIR